MPSLLKRNKKIDIAKVENSPEIINPIPYFFPFTSKKSNLILHKNTVLYSNEFASLVLFRCP